MATFIKCNGSGKFLAVNSAQGSDKAGAGLIQYDFTGDGTQQWQLEQDPSGAYKIMNLGSGLVIDVPGSSQQAGTQHIQWPANGGANQLWKMVNFTSGVGVAFLNANSEQYMNVAGASEDNGASVIQYPGFEGVVPPNAQWILSDQ
jgi:hypothetical protein